MQDAALGDAGLVAPDDLRGDALHEGYEPDPDYDEPAELPASEVAAPPRELPAPPRERAIEVEKTDPFATPRSGHLKPLNGNGNGHSNGNGGGQHEAVEPGNGLPAATATRPTSALEEKIRIARLKGYEGDPCQECGQLTLVRSGACAKCDTCGATSGCS